MHDWVTPRAAGWIELADRATFLDNGTVRYWGPPAGLLERPDLVRATFLGAAADGVDDARGEHEERAENSMYCAVPTALLGVVLLVMAHRRPAENPLPRWPVAMTS